MNIETNRLLIRKFNYEDWQDVYAYTSDVHVMKYIPEGVFSKDDAKKFVNENMKGNVKNFQVVLKNKNIIFGHIVFFNYFGDHTYEIAWLFNALYHQKEYA